MLGLPLAFAAPLVLLALAALPALWLLLRLTPPRPRRIDFRRCASCSTSLPTRGDARPARPGGCCCCASPSRRCVILALAGPVWNRRRGRARAAAPLLARRSTMAGPRRRDWRDARAPRSRTHRSRAERERPRRGARRRRADAAGEHLARHGRRGARAAARHAPRSPHRPTARAHLPAARALPRGRARRRGRLDHRRRRPAATADFRRAASRRSAEGRIVTVLEGRARAGRSRSPAPRTRRRASTRAGRCAPSRTGATAGTVRALDLKGLPLGEAPFAFAPGGARDEARFDLPVELRNEIARLEIAGERSAGAVHAARRALAAAAASASSPARPPTSPSRCCRRTYYLSRALAPFADVRRAAGRRRRRRSAASRRQAAGAGPRRRRQPRRRATRASSRTWSSDGGVLRALRRHAARRPRRRRPRAGAPARAAGARSAARCPGRSRRRSAPFARESPFSGLAVPADVGVHAPGPGRARRRPAGKTWAALADGTPHRHRRASAARGSSCSSTSRPTRPGRTCRCPACFVDMLRRIVGAGRDHGASAGAEAGNGARPQTLSRRAARSTATASSARRPPTAARRSARLRGARDRRASAGLLRPGRTARVAVNTLAPDDRPGAARPRAAQRPAIAPARAARRPSTCGAPLLVAGARRSSSPIRSPRSGWAATWSACGLRAPARAGARCCGSPWRRSRLAGARGRTQPRAADRPQATRGGARRRASPM